MAEASGAAEGGPPLAWVVGASGVPQGDRGQRVPEGREGPLLLRPPGPEESGSHPESPRGPPLPGAEFTMPILWPGCKLHGEETASPGVPCGPGWSARPRLDSPARRTSRSRGTPG